MVRKLEGKSFLEDLGVTTYVSLKNIIKETGWA